MDCDFSHPPELLTKLIGALEQNDVAIASRYTKGGADKRSADRVLTSWALNMFAQIYLSTKVKDYTTGYVAAKRNVFGKVSLSREGHGEYCIEFLYKCIRQGLKTVEIPFTCIDRKMGETKTFGNSLSMIKHGLKYGTKVLSLRFD